MIDSQGAPLTPVIGLEVHAQVTSESKMFCGCSARYFGAPPNSHVCAVCAGMPGALPVINRRGVEATVLTGMALNCTIARQFKFDRKNYSYPDLPKGYQITQYDLPIAQGGSLEFVSDGQTCLYGITRVHLEEDTGKSTHVTGDGDRSLIDYNRSGIPLMEIVGEPHLHSARAARDYFQALRELLVYLGVSDGNLQEGSMRADVNVSVRRLDGSLGTKVEVKNLNGFRAVQHAIEFEIERQRAALQNRTEIEQETRGWSEAAGETLPQRSKEYAHDYRYFPEPDLPPVELSASDVEHLRAGMPELPAQRRTRLEREHGLSPEAADVLTANHSLGVFYDDTLRSPTRPDPKLTARWLTQDVLRLLNDSGRDVGDMAMQPARFAAFLDLLASNQITPTTAKALLPDMVAADVDPEAAVQARGLAQVSDEAQIQAWVADAIAANPRAVADFLAGKEKAREAIVGRVMGASKGKANVETVRMLVQAALEARR